MSKADPTRPDDGSEEPREPMESTRELSDDELEQAAGGDDGWGGGTGGGTSGGTTGGGG